MLRRKLINLKTKINNVLNTPLKSLLFKVFIKLIPKISRHRLITKTEKKDCISLEQEGYEHYIKEPKQKLARHRFRKIAGIRKIEPFYGFMLKDVRLIGPYAIPVNRFGFVIMEPISHRMFPVMLKVTIRELGLFGTLKQYFLAIFPWFDSTLNLIEEGAHLLCRGAQWPGGPVFAHWMCEQLPQLRGIEGISNKLMLSPKIIINREPPKWQIESLNLMGYENEQIITHNVPGMRVKKLIFATLRNFHSNNLEFDPLARKWASRRLIKGLQKNSLKTPVTRKKNIALLRQNETTRYIINVAELKICLEDYEFHVFEGISHLGFIESAMAFNNASNFFAVHGSGIANIMFMKEPKKLIEIYAQSRDYSELFFLFASEFDMDYECIAAGTMPDSYSSALNTQKDSNKNIVESYNVVIPEIISLLKDT